MERDDRLYLFHIRECIARIEQYVSAGRNAFFSDTKTQGAVLRNLHILIQSADFGRDEKVPASGRLAQHCGVSKCARSRLPGRPPPAHLGYRSERHTFIKARD